MTKQAKTFVPEAISASLLKVGTTLETQGKIHQALTPYLKLISHYPGSSEAPIAVERVLSITESLRNAGHFHVVMAVLDRLERAFQTGQEVEKA